MLNPIKNRHYHFPCNSRFLNSRKGDMAMEVELGPTEETVGALLDYLVDPFLSSHTKSIARDAPSISHQQLVAKQVHAVVLLYNYYHRKCHQELEILTFESFCKLAVLLKPNLLPYMNLMHQSNYSEIDDLENQLSLTEKAIMDACDISLALDASKQVPETEGWPISKVAILLIDSRKENCLLFLGTVTAGVWSVIEKDLDARDMNYENKMGAKHMYKRMRVTKKPTAANQNGHEAAIQKLALLTIKEVAGINEADLVTLESHAVYSLSKEKTTARFYIMQCAQPRNEDFPVPIKKVIESLQGPLVKKRSCGWLVTPAVEYFHMLPYVGIMQDWLSREMLPNDLQDPVLRSQDKHNDQSFCSVVNITNRQQNTSKIEGHMRAPMNYMMTEAEVVDSMSRSCTTGRGDEKNDSQKHCGISLSVQCAIPSGNYELAPLRSKSQEQERLAGSSASKEDSLSKTAEKMLLNKREKLSHQLRDLADEIALCDKTIQTMQQGGESDLDLMKYFTIQVSNVCREREENAQPGSKKRFSEAILSMRNPCQELDDICHTNNWRLPTYHVLPSDGGFQSSVKLKGFDFELTIKGNVHLGSRAARESAAANMITRLRSLVGRTE